MELNVNIDPDQINKMVSDAVLDSALGEQVKKTIAEQVKAMSGSYNNPLEAVIKLHISDIVQQVLINDYADELKTKIAESVAEKMKNEFISDIIEAGLRRY